jgi:predicted enzyme related to lactoylglutathione lyase
MTYPSDKAVAVGSGSPDLRSERGRLVITKASSIGIFVRDQDRALQFYTEKLGFEILQDVPMGDPMPPEARWLVVAPKGSDMPFVLFTPPGLEERIGGFSNIVWDTDDIQATYEDLKGRGVEFTRAPERQSWGWWAQFKDVDGNEFGLHQTAR